MPGFSWNFQVYQLRDSVRFVIFAFMLVASEKVVSLGKLVYFFGALQLFS